MGRKRTEIDPLELEALSILRERFDSSGMTYQELADVAGLSHATVFRSLKGERATTVSEIGKISRALDVRVWRVFKEAQERLAVRQAEEAVRATTADPAATYIATAEAKLQAVLRGDYAPAARRHEPDPLQGIGEENQDEGKTW